MALLFVSIRLLVEVYSMCLSIWKHRRSTLPDVTIKLVVLITVVGRWLRSSLATPSHPKINHSSPRRLHLIQVIVVTCVVSHSWPCLLSFRSPEIYILANAALYVLQRVHDISVPPVYTFICVLSASCHPRHIDHALATVTRLFQGVVCLFSNIIRIALELLREGCIDICFLRVLRPWDDMIRFDRGWAWL